VRAFSGQGPDTRMMVFCLRSRMALSTLFLLLQPEFVGRCLKALFLCAKFSETKALERAA